MDREKQPAPHTKKSLTCLSGMSQPQNALSNDPALIGLSHTPDFLNRLSSYSEAGFLCQKCKCVGHDAADI